MYGIRKKKLQQQKSKDALAKSKKVGMFDEIESK